MRTTIAFEREATPAEQAGRITRKKGSSKLYVDFYYNGVRIEKSTGLADGPENYMKARQWLDRQMEKIARGTFRFAEAFPGAPESEKAFHAAREGWEYKPQPRDILFEEYAAKWEAAVLSGFRSPGKRRDFKQVMDCWLLPYFGRMSFHQIHAVEVQRFLNQLKWRSRRKAGQPLSRSRASNILIPLRAIWSDVCEENHWDLPDPFRFVKKHLPEGGKEHPEGFRFDEWMRIIGSANPYYVPVLEVMVRTGMIASELAGFRKGDIVNGEMAIRNSIVLGHEKSDLKTKYRKRSLPITKALKRYLDELLERAKGEYLFTMEDGSTFNGDSFRKTVWVQALKKAGVKYRRPYAIRHSHAAWALALGMDENRLVRLMGHGSKQMVYEVYGSYIPGLENDKERIREYLGEDFM